MATLELTPAGSFILRTRYEEKDMAKAAGFRWSPDARAWVCDHPDPDKLTAAFGGNGALKIVPAAQEKLAQVRAAENAALRWQNVTTCEPVRSLLPLSDYQNVGARFLADARRAILADELGLGKTPQVIAAANLVDARRILVVAPKSLLPQWVREIARFSIGDTRAAIIDRRSPLPSTRWTVTNYETVTTRAAELAAQKYDVLIVDEAVRAKNREAKRTQALYTVAHSTRYAWLITGTPIRNRPHEIWSLLYILDPKRYGGPQGINQGFWRFVYRFCEVEKTPYGTEIGGLRADKADEFKRELAPRLIRRNKKLLNLPPLSRETIYVEMGAAQAKSYREAESGILRTIDPERVTQIPGALAQLTRLRQICLAPSLCNVAGEAAKIEWLLDWMEDNGDDHKIIIFSTFAEFCRVAHSHLCDTRHGVTLLTGAESQVQREAAISRFKTDPTCRAIVISAEAGSEGLNLQEADVVIWLNKPWTPDLVEQGTARAWRRGQENPVHEISLVVPDTIEEAMERVLSRKDASAKAALNIEAVVRDLKERRGIQ